MQDDEHYEAPDTSRINDRSAFLLGPEYIPGYFLGLCREGAWQFHASRHACLDKSGLDRHDVHVAVAQPVT